MRIVFSHALPGLFWNITSSILFFRCSFVFRL